MILLLSLFAAVVLDPVPLAEAAPVPAVAEPPEREGVKVEAAPLEEMQDAMDELTAAADVGARAEMDMFPPNLCGLSSVR
jgi:hypothetical protein